MKGDAWANKSTGNANAKCEGGTYPYIDIAMISLDVHKVPDVQPGDQLWCNNGV